MNTQLPTSPWLTQKEAADYLKVSARSLRDWEAQGSIRPQRTPGGRCRYHMKDLDHLLVTGKWPKTSHANTPNQKRDKP